MNNQVALACPVRPAGRICQATLDVDSRPRSKTLRSSAMMRTPRVHTSGVPASIEQHTLLIGRLKQELVKAGQVFSSVRPKLPSKFPEQIQAARHVHVMNLCMP